MARAGGRRIADYTTKLNLPLAADQTPPEVHRRIVEELSATMAANVAGIASRLDIEFLHDYRVALRRLRSYLSAAKLTAELPQSLSARLTSVWQASGSARDRDVFLTRRSYYTEAAPPSLRGEVEELFGLMEYLRDRAYQELLERVGGGFEVDPAELLRTMRVDSREPVAEFAGRLVRSRRRRFEKAVRQLQDAYLRDREGLDDEWIHAARKAAKKYRYLQEIFAPILHESKEAKGRVKRLRRLQDLLGSYNDLVVEERTFQTMLAEERAEIGAGEGQRISADVRGALGYMLALVEGEKRHARSRVLQELEREVG